MINLLKGLIDGEKRHGTGESAMRNPIGYRLWAAGLAVGTFFAMFAAARLGANELDSYEEKDGLIISRVHSVTIEADDPASGITALLNLAGNRMAHIERIPSEAPDYRYRMAGESGQLLRENALLDTARHLDDRTQIGRAHV